MGGYGWLGLRFFFCVAGQVIKIDLDQRPGVVNRKLGVVAIAVGGAQGCQVPFVIVYVGLLYKGTYFGFAQTVGRANNAKGGAFAAAVAFPMLKPAAAAAGAVWVWVLVNVFYAGHFVSVFVVVCLAQLNKHKQHKKLFGNFFLTLLAAGNYGVGNLGGGVCAAVALF